MFASNLFLSGQVGDGAGDFQNSVVGPGGEIELGNGHFEERLGLILECAEFSRVLGAHGGVAMDFS